MSLVLRLLELYLPAAVRDKGLHDLCLLTADAFACQAPDWQGLPYGERLEKYARFTAEQAQAALDCGGDLSELRDRLYRGARGLGRKMRRKLGVCSVAEAMRAARLLYRAIGIDFEGSGDGEITIRSCYFSRFYSGEVCRLISALDAGLLAGLSGGGELAFSRRLTEGEDCCRARFAFPESER